MSADVYKDYTISLAYDLAQTKQTLAFSDHSDIVSRRMGFIPLPLGVVMLRVVYTSVRSTNPGAVIVALMAYVCLFTFRVLGSIVILGKACDLIDEHKTKQEKKKTSVDESKSRSETAETAAAAATTEKVAVHQNSPGQDTKRQADDSVLTSPRVEQLLPTDKELFELPDQSAERLFIFQNSCEDRSDVLLTNMNSAMIENEDDEAENIYRDVDTDRILEGIDASSEDCGHSVGPIVKEKIVGFPSLQTPEKTTKTGHFNSGDFSPATKAKSLSSPDLIRPEGEYDEWEAEEEELIIEQQSLRMEKPADPKAATATEHFLHSPGLRRRDAAEST